MFNVIAQLVLQNPFVVFISLALLILALEITIIFMKKRFPVLTFLLALLVIPIILGAVVIGQFFPDLLTSAGITIDPIEIAFYYCIGLIAIQVIIFVIILLLKLKDKRVIKEMKELHPECQAIIKGKKIIFLDSYREKLPYKKKEIKSAKINDKKIGKKMFYSYLRNKDAFLLYLELENKVLEVSFKTEKIIIDDKENGKALYVTIFKEGKQDDFVRSAPFKVEDLLVYANLQKDVSMFYDQEIGSYRLSENMAHLLGTKEIVSEKSYQEIIIASDLPIYLNREFSKEKPISYNYRVNSINGIDWVEQTTYYANGRYYDIVRLAKRPQAHYHYLGTDSLVESLKKYEPKKKKVAIVLLTFNSLRKYLKQDPRLLESIIHEYFQKVLKEETIYQLSSLDYAYFIENKKAYDSLAKDLENKASKLLTDEVYVLENKYDIKNDVEVILSSSFKSNDIFVQEVLEKLNLSEDLEVAVSVDNLNEVKLEPLVASPEAKEVVVPEEGYDFESSKIDLNDDDLDEYR